MKSFGGFELFKTFRNSFDSCFINHQYVGVNCETPLQNDIFNLLYAISHLIFLVNTDNF
jgi:hypothetical protein